MHALSYILICSSSLLLLSVLASKASGLLGIPSLIMFIGVGMLAGSDGPGGIYFEDAFTAQALGIIALILILFAGGLDTSWPNVKPLLGSALMLSTLSVIVTCVLIGGFAKYALHFTWLEGLLLGAIVSSTDAAAVFSVLEGQKVELRDPIKPLLELESGSNDPMAAFLTVGMIQLISGKSPLSLIPQFVQQMFLGVILGIIFGKATQFLLNRVRLESAGLYPVVTTAFAFFAYGFAEIVGGNGFLTVYVMGIVLGNCYIRRKRNLILFHHGFAWLMQIVMFLALGLFVSPKKLLPIASTATLLAVFLIFIARPLGVFLALAKSPLSMAEKGVVSWVGLRGAVPIVLATYPWLAKVPQAEMIFHVVFFIVLTSVLIQGTTIRWVTKWLQVDQVRS